MKRAPILKMLGAHASTGIDAHEAAMAADMIRFVETRENCAERSLLIGHLTGSAWIVDAARRRTLLTHHRKLGMWLQLGGHADGELDLASVAMREAREESGLSKLQLVTDADGAVKIFDVDRHRIPGRGAEPEHWHYDVRFLVEGDPDEPLVITSESKELAWVDLADVARLNPDESMLRMVRKTPAGQGARGGC
ncbi:8-oxo-dGTP pyrophosphatase MutT (NUDIX family) [Ereboglobus sp. PH5-5]|nr:8-oxo-dGTP pyrophosphatase MutT (NUDIX family) [Ereboglobus sp. PH5-10]MDF9832467.1 8-oxo-dGTP pyrophosphatase MutT (NUDIX family) [Ereboglobus sp. PH5-5]